MEIFHILLVTMGVVFGVVIIVFSLTIGREMCRKKPLDVSIYVGYLQHTYHLIHIQPRRRIIID